MASRAHLPGNRCGQVGRGQEHKFSGYVQGDKNCGKGRNTVRLPGLHPTVKHSVHTCIGYLCVRVCLCVHPLVQQEKLNSSLVGPSASARNWAHSGCPISSCRYLAGPELGRSVIPAGGTPISHLLQGTGKCLQQEVGDPSWFLLRLQTAPFP